MKQSRKASATMMYTSIMRAVHQVMDADPKILDDPLAVGLVEGSSREEILGASPSSQSPIWFRSTFVLRSRYTEDSLAEAVVNGIEQYVMLGAGMDTFAYRQLDWGARLRTFESIVQRVRKLSANFWPNAGSQSRLMSLTAQ
jgi:O-methyltransferase involved in polyketide biosynthesis